MQMNGMPPPASLIEELASFTPSATGQKNIEAEIISITCYENEVPSFVAQGLSQLYGNLFSSIAHLEVHGSTFDASAYIARHNHAAICILLFTHSKSEVKVINEGMRLSLDEIGRFSRFIFGTYRSARKISFNAVSVEVGNISFVNKRFPCTENIILSLPPTEEEYTAKLGKSTRKNVKHHLSRLKRSFPSFEHTIYHDEEIREEDVLAIIEFNKKRMAGKNKVSHLNREKSARIIQLVKRCGFISLIKIDGRVCAGAICYCTGLTVTSHVNAHDPQYDDFRLGTLCCYLAICESIKKGAKEFHFLWGRYEYKYALLGVEQNLERVFVYRSYTHLILDGKTICRNKVNSGITEIKNWIKKKEKMDNTIGRVIKKTLKCIKG